MNRIVCKNSNPIQVNQVVVIRLIMGSGQRALCVVIICANIGSSIGESIYNQKQPNPTKLIQKGFYRILVDIIVLNSILKVYPILTSGKGSFPIWHPRWVSRSYNSHISISIQSRKVVFCDFGINKGMKSLKLSTAKCY